MLAVLAGLHTLLLGLLLGRHSRFVAAMSFLVMVVAMLASDDIALLPRQS